MVSTIRGRYLTDDPELLTRWPEIYSTGREELMTTIALDPAANPSYPMLLAERNNLKQSCEAFTIAVRRHEAALRYCEFHMTETGWPKDHPMLVAVRKALGSPASGGSEHE